MTSSLCMVTSSGYTCESARSAISVMMGISPIFWMRMLSGMCPFRNPSISTSFATAATAPARCFSRTSKGSSPVIITREPGFFSMVIFCSVSFCITELVYTDLVYVQQKTRRAKRAGFLSNNKAYSPNAALSSASMVVMSASIESKFELPKSASIASSSSEGLKVSRICWSATARGVSGSLLSI